MGIRSGLGRIVMGVCNGDGYEIIHVMQSFSRVSLSSI